MTRNPGDMRPLSSRATTQAEGQALVVGHRRKSGIRGAVQLLPWLLDETSPGQVRLPHPASRTPARRLPPALAAPVRAPRLLAAAPTAASCPNHLHLAAPRVLSGSARYTVPAWDTGWVNDSTAISRTPNAAR